MAIFTALNKGWRIVGTGIAFVVFGLGALILGNIWMMMLRLIYREPNKRRQMSQYSIHLCFFCFVSALKWLRIIDYKIEGKATLLQDRGCLIAANHPSLLDYVLIGAMLPEMDCIVKESLFHNPFCRMVVRNAGYIPNSADPEKLLEACKVRLQQGGKLLIFPEGTRTPLNAETLRLQRGAANLAVRCQVPVRLVHIRCQPRSLSKEQKWYQVPPTKSLFEIRAGELLSVSSCLTADLPLPKAVRQFNKNLADKLFF